MILFLRLKCIFSFVSSVFVIFVEAFLWWLVRYFSHLQYLNIIINLFIFHYFGDLPGSLLMSHFGMNPDTLDIVLWDYGSYLTLLFLPSFSHINSSGKWENTTLYLWIGVESMIPTSVLIENQRVQFPYYCLVLVRILNLHAFLASTNRNVLLLLPSWLLLTPQSG